MKIELALRSPGRRHLRRRRIHEKISLLERCIFLFDRLFPISSRFGEILIDRFIKVTRYVFQTLIIQATCIDYRIITSREYWFFECLELIKNNFIFSENDTIFSIWF